VYSSLAQFFVTAAIVVVAGSFLTRATDRLADHLGIGRTLAGMLLLALATSLPELAVGCNAALMGKPDLTVGDVLGSSLMNLLMLAVLDLTHYSRGQMFSKAAAANTLTAGAGVVMTSIVLLFILLRPEASIGGRIGFGSVALVVAYACSIRLIFIQQRTLQKSLSPAEKAAEKELARGHSLRRDAIVYGVGAGVILGVVPFLTQAAGDIADQSGLGESFIGSTMVALTTSLPEVVTTLAAVRMRAFDLAVGNIFGSNAFNMIILVAVDLFYAKPLYANVQTYHAVTAGWVILVTMVAVMGLLYQEEKRYWVFEPDAALIIVLVAAALFSVYLVTQGVAVAV
jgi:cation:H+ antiporter